MTGHTAAGDRVALDAGFHAARTRLRNLVRGGMLQRAGSLAYGQGITALAELAGPAARLTRLADLMLAPAGEQASVLSLAGAFWPPPALAGAGLSQVIVRYYVTAITGSFLDTVACELGHPASR
jgi:hypothetical protein